MIFLCGASVGNAPSPRRQAVKRYIESISDSHTVIYAEGVFSEIIRHGHKKNILDLEYEISELADKIVIILESESAFCELGAFASEALRRKLIIINSSHFKHSQSFVNLGPIAAATEANGRVLWYPMVSTATKDLDGIGAIFSELKDGLDHKSQRGERISLEKISKLGMNKYSLYFIHDLVVLAGLIAHDELIEILKCIFPEERRFDALKNLIGVLRESGLIESQIVANRRLVRATSTEFFLKYGFDLAPLMAAFRTFHLRAEPERYLAA